MAIFTKTFVRCDACDQELELPRHNGNEEWFRVRTEVRRLDAGEAEDALIKREVDFCPRCYSALQESEFSTLFDSDAPESKPSVVQMQQPD